MSYITIQESKHSIINEMKRITSHGPAAASVEERVLLLTLSVLSLTTNQLPNLIEQRLNLSDKYYNNLLFDSAILRYA